MRFVNRIRTAALIAGAGAGAAYLLDPVSGRDRRQRILDVLDEARAGWSGDVSLPDLTRVDRIPYAVDPDPIEDRAVTDLRITVLDAEPDLSAARNGSDPRVAAWMADVLT